MHTFYPNGYLHTSCSRRIPTHQCVHTPARVLCYPEKHLQIPRRGKPPPYTPYIILLCTYIILPCYTIHKYHSAHLRARVVVCVCSYAYLYITVYTYSVSTIPRIRSYAHFPPVSHGTAFLPLLPSLAQALFHVYCVSTVCRIVPSCYFGRLRTFVAVIQPRFYARKIHFGTYIYLSAYFDRLHVANSLRNQRPCDKKLIQCVTHNSNSSNSLYGNTFFPKYVMQYAPSTM